ncbi:MAG: hypothetical protein ACSLFD_06340, partial [Solirubrobacterales bacterium]
MSAAPGGEVIVYAAPDGEVRVDVRLDRETVWLTQAQMAEIEKNDFNLNISRYISTTKSEVEIDQSATDRDVVEIEKQVRDS